MSNLNSFLNITSPQPSKPCAICGELKELCDFPGHRGHADRLDSRCRSCKRNYDRLLKKLKKNAPPRPKVCECCGKFDESLRLDHDHKTLEIRGWICDPCNVGIGKLGDSIEGIEKALKYLQKN